MGTCLTVVVTANIGRDLYIIDDITGTYPRRCWIILKVNSISISPDVLTRSTSICDGHSFNIDTINGYVIVGHCRDKMQQAWPADILVAVHTLGYS